MLYANHKWRVIQVRSSIKAQESKNFNKTDNGVQKGMQVTNTIKVSKKNEYAVIQVYIESRTLVYPYFLYNVTMPKEKWTYTKIWNEEE